MKCPKCKKEIEEVFEVHGTDKPFCAQSPLEGLTAWGPYDVPKKIICHEGNIVHFRFSDLEERLVIMKPDEQPYGF